MEEKQENMTPMIEMTAGEMLRNARTTGRRKREISTISKLLCIREDFLAALEEGNYRFIPEDVYILGFARSYAVELGLNPDEVIAKLKRELGLLPEEKKDEKKEDNTERKCIEPIADKFKFDMNKIKAWFVNAGKYVKKHWVWFASGFGVLLVALVLVLVLTTAKTESTDVASETALQDKEVVEVVKKEPEFRYPVREKYDADKKKEWDDSRVVLQFEKEAWFRIEDGHGKSVFSRVLLPGDVYYVPNKDNMKGTFNNAGAIDIWVDGQLLKKIGKMGEKKTGVSMSPDSLKALGFAD